MASRKKKTATKTPRRTVARVELPVRMPIALLAFYEGVAAYAGVSLDDCFNVVLALGMLRDQRSQSTP